MTDLVAQKYDKDMNPEKEPKAGDLIYFNNCT